MSWLSSAVKSVFGGSSSTKVSTTQASATTVSPVTNIDIFTPIEIEAQDLSPIAQAINAMTKNIVSVVEGQGEVIETLEEGTKKKKNLLILGAIIGVLLLAKK